MNAHDQLMPLEDTRAFSGIRSQIQDLNQDNIAELANAAAELQDVIPLWYGEGDAVTPDFIREAAKRAIDEGQTFYVPDMRGTTPLNIALSDYLSKLYGRTIDLDRSTITPSGMQAMHLAMLTLIDSGTNGVYLAPQWPNTAASIHMAGGEPRAVPLAFDGDFKLDLDRIIDACDAKTRVIVWSSPANPTGWTATYEDLRALLEFSRKTGIWLISDEVYHRLYADGVAAPSILEIADDEDRVLVVNSFSKSWAMTGWRVGWLNHPLSLAPSVSAMTQYINSGTAAILQAGAVAALRQGEPYVDELRNQVRAGLDCVYDHLSGVETIMLPKKPRGGMYAFFRLKGHTNSRDTCRMLLERTKVGLAPGVMFGDAGEGFVRMCVFREKAVLQHAVDRIATVLTS